MSLQRYKEFIKRYSYDRYDNFDNLDENTKIYPIMTPISCENVWKLDIHKLKEKRLGNTFPLIQNATRFTNVVDCISIISYYSVAILRCEAQNPYFYHCAVPSAKGIHPCECYYIVKIQGETQLLRFNSATSAVEIVKSMKNYSVIKELLNLKEISEDDVIAIVASDMFRLAKYYGSFSYILSAIDAGHVSSQIGMVAARGAKEVNVYYDIDIEEISKYLGVDYNEIHPEVVMHLKLFKNESDLKSNINYKLKNSRKSYYKNQMYEFDEIININKALVEDFKNRGGSKKG